MTDPSHPSADARRAAGRLCVVDFPGPEPPDRFARLIAEWHIAGVVLFQKNIRSPAQVAALTEGLQHIAREVGAPPLWIAIDHEGGAVNRFGPAAAGDGNDRGPHVTPLPSAMALGATRDPALAEEAGMVAGRELRVLGIHQNYAPVLDINSNPANPVIGARAFGETAELVESMGLAYIAGLEAAGVAATAKHFPGHGDVTVDSHLALPRVDHAVARLERTELAPFAAAARNGVSAIMTAHIVYPALDPGRAPATMSAPILNGLLRGRLGFGGLICSDAMAMRAIADNYGVGDAAVAAVRAGCDMLLALGPEATQQEVLDRLASAIEAGDLPAQRVADAHKRFDAVVGWVRARKSATPNDATHTAPGGAIDPAAHMDTARRIAEAAVTLVRNGARIVPVRSGQLRVVNIAGKAGENQFPDFAGVLRDLGAPVVTAPEGDTTADDTLIAVTCTRGPLPAEHAAAIRDLHRRHGDRLVVMATGDPYDLLRVPEVRTYLVTYGPDRPSLEAGGRVLLGHIRPRGQLPVTLPDLYPAGHGLRA